MKYYLLASFTSLCTIITKLITYIHTNERATDANMTEHDKIEITVIIIGHIQKGD